MSCRTVLLRRHLLTLLAALVLLGAVASLGTPAAAEESAQPGVTTTTLPIDNRQLGEIIPQPNAGREPETAGDPGGWLQVSLFFLLVGAVVVICTAVWWSSRRARERRAAAGLDPISVARRRGEGVRAPHGGAPTSPSGDAPQDP